MFKKLKEYRCSKGLHNYKILKEFSILALNQKVFKCTDCGDTTFRQYTSESNKNHSPLLKKVHCEKCGLIIKTIVLKNKALCPYCLEEAHVLVSTTKRISVLH